MCQQVFQSHIIKCFGPFTEKKADATTLTHCLSVHDWVYLCISLSLSHIHVFMLYWVLWSDMRLFHKKTSKDQRPISRLTWWLMNQGVSYEGLLQWSGGRSVDFTVAKDCLRCCLQRSKINHASAFTYTHALPIQPISNWMHNAFECTYYISLFHSLWAILKIDTNG